MSRCPPPSSNWQLPASPRSPAPAGSHGLVNGEATDADRHAPGPQAPEWHAWLELPAGLSPQAAAAGPALAILLGLRDPGSCPGGTRPGWLVLIGRPGGAEGPLPPGSPAIHLPEESAAGTCPGDPGQGRVQLAGDYAIRPGPGYAILLSGTPAARFLPIVQDGILASGKIIARRD